MGAPRIDRLDKNFLINGNFDFSQRGSGNTSMLGSASYLTADRWRIGYNGASWSGTPTTWFTTSVPAWSLSERSLIVQGTPTAKNDITNFQVSQRIESVFSKHAANKRVTFGFNYVTDTNAGSDCNVTVEFSYPTAKNNWASSTLISTQTFVTAGPGAWNSKVITLDLPPNVINGLQVLVKFSNISTGGNRQFYLNDCCMLLGEFTTIDFVYAGRDYAEELQLCQRYYELVSPTGLFARTTTTISALCKYTTYKRVNAIISMAPGVTFVEAIRLSGAVVTSSSVGNPAIDNGTPSSFCGIDGILFPASLVAGEGLGIRQPAFWFQADAEL